MNIDKCRHEIVMVQGGLDSLADLLSKHEERGKNSDWVIIEMLSKRLQRPINFLEKLENKKR